MSGVGPEVPTRGDRKLSGRASGPSAVQFADRKPLGHDDGVRAAHDPSAPPAAWETASMVAPVLALEPLRDEDERHPASRELVGLGTAAQAPTRNRNHNGYVLRWDGRAILFDPGE